MSDETLIATPCIIGGQSLNERLANESDSASTFTGEERIGEPSVGERVFASLAVNDDRAFAR